MLTSESSSPYPEYNHKLQKDNVFLDTPEVTEPIWLEPKRGSIPRWINGIMYRTGPAKYKLDNDTVITHALDGMPFAHRFEFKDGKVRYNSRHIAASVEKALLEKTQVPLFVGYTPDKDSWMWKAPKMLEPPASDPAAVLAGETISAMSPVVPIGSGSAEEDGDPLVVVARSSGAYQQHIHSDTLEPKRAFKYGELDPQLEGMMSSSHAKVDPITREVVNFMAHPATGITVFSHQPKTSTTTILGTITHRKIPNTTTADPVPIEPSFIHSFWLSPTYVIIPEIPLRLKNGGMDAMQTGSFATGLAWDQGSPAYLHIVSRVEKQHVASVEVRPGFFMFHDVNAYEDQSNLVLDAPIFDDADILMHTHMFGSNGIQSTASSLPQQEEGENKMNGMTYPPRQDNIPVCRFCRFWIDTRTWQLKEHKVLADHFEFPAVARPMQSYRFAWGASGITPSSSRGGVQKFPQLGLVKVDIEQGTTTRFDKQHWACQEPILVSKPGSDQEDDGVLLTQVNAFDANGVENLLVIIDAKTMKELAVCVIGDFAATTLHGSYIDLS